MKMLPIPLSLSGPPLGLWSDVLWRYPPAPQSPLTELKTQLPPQLPPDPRLWGREDVTIFLRFCEREFDLPKFELELFQMNGKALCLLTKNDFGERCPGAGDVLHNVLQMLIRESQMMHRHLPSSPVTPTSRYPLSPHSHPPTPNWASLAPPENPFHNAHLHHFMQPNSVTLSPAPSIDSQASSPPQNQEANQNVFSQNNATSSSSNQSDSDEDSYTESTVAKPQAQQQQQSSPPPTPVLKDIKPSLSQQITNVVNSWSNSQNHNLKNESSAGNVGGSISAPSTPGAYMSVKREFFPDSPEPNTNGRLLWDFLQQLLNDPAQRYSNYIAWKCRDTGVFKIVDPPGLAKLWGIQKNHLSMNYDKMSRALRYYYRVNILRKVQGERHCYQFLRNPSELKNIKNISLLRQSVANASSNGAANSSSATNNNSVASAGAASAPVSSSPLSSSSSSSSTSTLSTSSMTAPPSSVPSPHSHPAAHHQQQQQQQQVLNHLQQQHALSVHQQQQQQQMQHASSQLGLPQGLSPMSLPALSSSSISSPPSVSSLPSLPYGPPPTSPLIMHAINGAFHYLSTSSQPQSPVMPQTPSEKLSFHTLKIDSSPCGSGSNGSSNNNNSISNGCNGSHQSVNGNHSDSEDMKPTDLSVSSDRRYNTSNSIADCYPLIRNSDGLTTIKLIRCNNENSSSSSSSSPSHHQSPSSTSSSPPPSASTAATTTSHHHQHHPHHHHQQQQQQQQQQMSQMMDYHQTLMKTEPEDVNIEDSAMLPTDLRK